MFLIHPKRYIRKFKNWREIYNLKRKAKKYGVQLQIGSGVRLVGCTIRENLEYRKTNYINTTLIIGDNSFLKYASFSFCGDNSTIHLGENIHINGGEKGRTNFLVGANSSITIGNDCLFSSNIRFWTTDFHPVLDMAGNVVNRNRDVYIGEHVWVGMNVFISKGVTIAKNSIVGAFSVVTKCFNKENVVIAGNPAIVRKNGITWEEYVEGWDQLIES